MSSIHCVSINNGNITIETTVVSHESRLDEALSWLLSKVKNETNPNTKGLVGFGIEKAFMSSETTQFVSNKVALLKFCVGNHCLLVHVIHFAKIPTSLAKFFNFPNLTFAGTNVSKDLADLHRDYGIQCRASFELLPLTNPLTNCMRGAKIYHRYYLSKLPGIYDRLRFNSSMLAMVTKIPNEADFADWDCSTLSEEQITRASVDAFVAFNFIR